MESTLDMTVLEIYLEILANFFEILYPCIIISVISSTQIVCDVMCIQYVQKQPTEVFFKKRCSEKFW